LGEELPVILLTGVVELTADEEKIIRRNEAYVFYKPEGSMKSPPRWTGY
jgi:hypothetical protein